MKKDIYTRIAQFFKRNEASVTIESTLILPLFLMLLFTIILIGIAMLYANTSTFVQLTAVERAAFNWDKYDRQFNTGIKQSHETYGLYEQDLTLTYLRRLFQIDSSKKIASIPIQRSTELQYPTGQLKQDKLLQANNYLFNGELQFSGSLNYVHEDFLPRVSIESINESLPLNLTSKGYASAIIIDATQHIRGVDLLIYYGLKIKAMNDNARGWVEKAKSAIPSS